MEEQIDFRLIVDQGMGLLVPLSDGAKQLIDGGAFGDVVRFGRGIGVDRRYVGDLIENLRQDGWEVLV